VNTYIVYGRSIRHTFKMDKQPKGKVTKVGLHQNFLLLIELILKWTKTVLLKPTAPILKILDVERYSTLHAVQYTQTRLILLSFFIYSTRFTLIICESRGTH